MATQKITVDITIQRVGPSGEEEEYDVAGALTDEIEALDSIEVDDEMWEINSAVVVYDSAKDPNA